MKSIRCTAAALALAAGVAFANDPCRPTAFLQVDDELVLHSQHYGAHVRLEATLARDLPIQADLATLGVGKAGGPLQRESGVVRGVLDWRDLADGRGRLYFEGEKHGHVLVTHKQSTYIMYFADGEPRTADGSRLEVAPSVGKEVKFVVPAKTKVHVVEGKPVLPAGSTLVFGRAAGDVPVFRLVAPARLDVTAAPTSPQRLEVVRPLRAAEAGKLVVTVSGVRDLASRKLSFCFDVAGAGAASKPIVAHDAKLVSQSGDVARFEVRVPKLDELWRSDAARVHLNGWIPSIGLPSVVRVVGYDDRNVVIDASGPLTLSDARIAIIIGIVMLALLFFASIQFMGRLSPFAIVGALVRGNSGRYSLSNLQVLMWTGLVLFAMTFNWATTGELLVISEGILVLLGIAGGASVLTRTMAAQATDSQQPAPASTSISGVSSTTSGGSPAPAHSASPAAPSNESMAKQLFGSSESEFDLLRFQMLGFTLFTWLYALTEVLNNQGLPEIPQSLYWLMGISNGAYIGGKVPDVLNKRNDATAGLSEVERQISQADVKAMQAALGIAQSGVIDSATRNAVINFKKANGIIPATGVIDKLLLNKIKVGKP